jgi:hypothetical protein
VLEAIRWLLQSLVGSRFNVPRSTESEKLTTLLW